MLEEGPQPGTRGPMQVALWGRCPVATQAMLRATHDIGAAQELHSGSPSPSLETTQDNASPGSRASRKAAPAAAQGRRGQRWTDARALPRVSSEGNTGIFGNSLPQKP